MPEPNVECRRCGYRWFSETFDEDGDVPDTCTRCYREDVRKIPEEPTWLEQQVAEVRDRVRRVPQLVHEKRRAFVLWKENNRYLLDLAAFVAAIALIMGIVYMFIFRWG